MSAAPKVNGNANGRASPGAPILAVEGLRAGYGDIPVLRGVSMELAENEVLGLLGHNGMGKSTLLKALMGLLPATGGKIAFEGEPIARLPTWRRSRLGFGYVPQGRGIFPNLTVRENLHFAWSEETGDGSADAGIDRIVADFPRLIPLLDGPRSRMCCNGLQGVYRSILSEIVKRDYDVYSARVSPSKVGRVLLLFRLWIGGATPRRRPR